MGKKKVVILVSDVLFIDEIDYHDVLKELGEERESE